MGAAREARKTVTILFCDLVHSTGLAEGDPETYRRTQQRFFHEMRAVVEAYGGTVEKFIGDEVMAVFGVPVAHEDDALRAVRAAEEMQSAVAGLGLEATIGINTGEVLAADPSDGHSFVSGEAVIVAKRLEQGAEPGEIVIGKATYPLVAHAVSAGPLERIPVKGKRDDVGRHILEDVDREAPAVARRLHAPIVGREDELALLRTAFERAVDGNCCRLFTVLGAAGIGKSRLATELCSDLGEQATTATGRCLPYGEGITYWPLREVAAVLDAASLQEALDEDLPSEEAFLVVRRTFEESARERPLVLCFEDLHWAEPTFLDLVEYLAGSSRDAPILLVALARPELVEERPTWIAPRPNADAVALEPLSTREIQSLLDGLALEPALRERVTHAAEGNPLFAEQMAAMASENGREDLPIPGSLQGLLAERLDRLTREERDALERAAVVGRDFPVSALVSLADSEQRAPLTGTLMSLVRKGLIEPGASAGDEDRYTFQHVLVRDAAYEAMPKALRAELHERLADVCSNWEAGDELVGYHLEQAYRARSEVTPGDASLDDLARRAARSLATAGRRASAREDIPAALNLLDRAAVLLTSGRDDGLRAELLGEIASLMMNSGRFRDARGVLEEAAELAERVGDRRLELRLEIERAFNQAFTTPEGSTETILEVASSTIPELERLGDELGLAKAWWLASEPHASACRWSARAEALERGLEHARRAGDIRLQSTLVGSLAQTLLYGPMPVPEARLRSEELLAEGRASESVQAGVVSELAALHAMAGEIDEGRRLWKQASAIYDELGLRHRRAVRSLVAAEIELLAGDADGAVRELRYGDQLFEEMGDRGARSTLNAYLANALYAAGRLDEAFEASRLSEELGASDDIVTQALWRSARAQVLAERENFREAETLAREAEDLAEPTDFPDLKATAVLAHARVLQLFGRPSEAARLAGRAREIYAAKGNVMAADRAAEFMDAVR